MISSQRMDFAKKLLVETRTKVQIIARQSGFGTGERMSKVFRRAIGVSPLQYREQYGHTRQDLRQELRRD